MGDARIPERSLVIQEGDLAHVVVAADDLARVERVFGKAPEPH
jgi:Trk K+ transport system NAD-binding subunit